MEEIVEFHRILFKLLQFFSILVESDFIFVVLNDINQPTLNPKATQVNCFIRDMIATASPKLDE